MDIKYAFRLLPINPCDFEFFGFSFMGKYYFDKCAAFGCSISQKLFETFSTFLEYGKKVGYQIKNSYTIWMIFGRAPV